MARFRLPSHAAESGAGWDVGIAVRMKDFHKRGVGDDRDEVHVVLKFVEGQHMLGECADLLLRFGTGILVHGLHNLPGKLHQWFDFIQDV